MGEMATRIPLEEAFAVVGWTVAISSIKAPPPTEDADTCSSLAAMATFRVGDAAIARTATGAPRAGAPLPQQPDAFS
jgi:hypothetical protein